MTLQRTIATSAIGAICVTAICQVLFAVIPFIPTMGIIRFAIYTLLVFAADLWYQLR